ncbi:hypothetical protein [Merismopedia glauca]|uniref:Uncharacterized protein n=1 Tax=Merismopedia glauca CCAP 1448/3 TaxID=1296344 RepID=A0A2T1C829_9CYAN|nr:hypothetical protein [Merismopedia glauca]PSB04445.1 hypothetical protein C7B64_03915 [Merismopedia glauca CCAP 1448/3]
MESVNLAQWHTKLNFLGLKAVKCLVENRLFDHVGIILGAIAQNLLTGVRKNVRNLRYTIWV